MAKLIAIPLDMDRIAPYAQDALDGAMNTFVEMVRGGVRGLAHALIGAGNVILATDNFLSTENHEEADHAAAGTRSPR